MRLALTILAALLYALGWVAGIVHVALRWLWSAAAVGWDDAHRPRVHAPPERPVPAWPAERAA